MSRYRNLILLVLTFTFAPGAFALDLDKLENVTVRVITNEQELTQRSPNILRFPQELAFPAQATTAQEQATGKLAPSTGSNTVSAKPQTHNVQK